MIPGGDEGSRRRAAHQRNGFGALRAVMMMLCIVIHSATLYTVNQLMAKQVGPARGERKKAMARRRSRAMRSPVLCDAARAWSRAPLVRVRSDLLALVVIVLMPAAVSVSVVVAIPVAVSVAVSVVVSSFLTVPMVSMMPRGATTRCCGQDNRQE